MNTLFLLLEAASAPVTLSSCELLEWTEPGLLLPRTVDEDPTLPSIIVTETDLHAEPYVYPLGATVAHSTDEHAVLSSYDQVGVESRL
jgi:hypothetical protein